MTSHTSTPLMVALRRLLHDRDDARSPAVQAGHRRSVAQAASQRSSSSVVQRELDSFRRGQGFPWHHDPRPNHRDPSLGPPSRMMSSGGPARIVLIARGDEHRAWRIIDAFAERTGLEARRSHRVAEFLLGTEDREIQIVATLTDIDHEWRHHVELGSLSPHAAS